MRVLVTGGAGFIGSHLVDRLVGEGYRVRVVDNLSSGRVENLRRHIDSNAVELVVGDLNPYYGVCVPEMLRPLWVHVEFWSLIPHVIVRFILRRFCGVLVCDRGFMDFIVWVIVTLGHPSFLSSIYGRFLVRLAALEGPVYLYADIDTLAGRADVPGGFIARELVAYNILARYTSKCSVDTGRRSPQAVVEELLSCLETREDKSSTKA